MQLPSTGPKRLDGHAFLRAFDMAALWTIDFATVSLTTDAWIAGPPTFPASQMMVEGDQASTTGGCQSLLRDFDQRSDIFLFQYRKQALEHLARLALLAVGQQQVRPRHLC